MKLLTPTTAEPTSKELKKAAEQLARLKASATSRLALSDYALDDEASQTQTSVADFRLQLTAVLNRANAMSVLEFHNRYNRAMVTA